MDTSDHEVNIKILLDLLVKKGIVPNKEARNRMLAEMEGDVAALVLEDNRNQARALTLDGLRSAAHYDEFVDLVGNMERNGMIDRSGVQLPSRDSLLQSPQKARGLPRPLLADLLGYAKMWVYEKLVRSSLPDNPVADPFLLAYFPKPLGRDFSGYFAEHPLRREIIATAVVNYVLNNGGIRLLPRLMDELKMSLEETVLAYLAADAKAVAAQSRQRVLESGLAADAEHAALLKIEDSVEAAVLKR